MADKKDVITDIFNTSGLRDINLFKEVLKFFAANVGNVITPTKFTQHMKAHTKQSLSHNTARKYFEVIVDGLKVASPVDRVYIKKLHNKPTDKPHAYNKIYFFNDISVLDYMLGEVYKDTKLYENHDTKMCESLKKRNELFLSLVENGYTLKSGVYRYYSRKGDGSESEGAKTEKLLFCDIDIIAKKDGTKRNFVFASEEQLNPKNIDHYILLHALKSSKAEGKIYVIDFNDDKRSQEIDNIIVWGVNVAMENIARNFEIMS